MTGCHDWTTGRQGGAIDGQSGQSGGKTASFYIFVQFIRPNHLIGRPITYRIVSILSKDNMFKVRSKTVSVNIVGTSEKP